MVTVKIWMVLAVVLMVGEFILPGLVVMFVGLGALTVAGLLYYGVIHTILEQLITFFISSTVYCFSLRFLVLYFVPTDSEKQDLEKGLSLSGEEVITDTPIKCGDEGSVYYGQSHWKAINVGEVGLDKGQKAVIVKQDNITLHIKQV
jgi:membrane protein implicated in regulation of membrane protease activity